MAYVQSTGNSVPVSNQLIQAFGSNVGTNSTLLVMVCRDNTRTFSSIADTLGNSYGSSLESITDAGNQEQFDVWIANCPTGGANTVTVTYTGPLADGCILIIELSGRDTSTPTGAGKHCQANQATPGTGANGISCGTATAATGDDLVMFMADTGANRANTFTAGTGYTEKTETGDGAAGHLDAMVQILENSSSGTKTGTATTANNDHVLSVLVAVTAVAGGGGVTTVQVDGGLPRGLLRGLNRGM